MAEKQNNVLNYTENGYTIDDLLTGSDMATILAALELWHRYLRSRGPVRTQQIWARDQNPLAFNKFIPMNAEQVKKLMEWLQGNTKERIEVHFNGQ